MTSLRIAFLSNVLACVLVPAAVPCLSQGAQSTPAPAETLHASTQLVIVDVVVEDKSGHPIHGLTRDNFVLTEQKKPQTVRNFEEHSAASEKKPGPPMPQMPPGVFTDYTPFAPDSTLNILLIDALNTPMKDQIFVREQLLDYIKHEKPGTDVAIFGLTNRLVMLQGFTADPAVLRSAVEHLNSKASPLLDDPVGGGNGQESMSDTMQDAGSMNGNNSAFAQALAGVQQFEAEQAAMQTHMRTQYTLDAFNDLAHYLANFPGRKNLIWFSGSFPLQIEPDPTLNDPFAVMEDSNEEFRETTNLLTLAQVAVYPVDGRGLMTAPMFSAANSGQKYARSPSAFTNDAMKFSQSQAQEHMTMEEMASDTGGHAYYNTNGLADAVAKAIEAGSNYYTLTYSPADHNWNGVYRNIHVELAGSAAAQGLKLAYRHGYYADDPQQPTPKPKHGELPTKPTPTAPAPAELADHAAEAYSRAAISRGSPAPADILFKVRVVPLTGKNDDTLAPANEPNPDGKMKAPYRTFAVDYLALPGDFSLMPQSDGRHTGTVEFAIFVYDAEGNLLNISDRKLSLNFSPDIYKRFEANPVRLQMLVSAPVKQESFMRVIIHDVPSNHYGVVEIPTAEVGHLPPLEAQNTPANAASPNTGATQPTGKQ
jgi:VWFA-related protein